MFLIPSILSRQIANFPKNTSREVKWLHLFQFNSSSQRSLSPSKAVFRAEVGARDPTAKTNDNFQEHRDVRPKVGQIDDVNFGEREESGDCRRKNFARLISQSYSVSVAQDGMTANSCLCWCFWVSLLPCDIEGIFRKREKSKKMKKFERALSPVMVSHRSV